MGQAEPQEGAGTPSWFLARRCPRLQAFIWHEGHGGIAGSDRHSCLGRQSGRGAVYFNVTPRRNDGTTVYHLDVKDVHMTGFWSVSVYDADGSYQPNPLNAYTLDNITAKKADDGSITIQLAAVTKNRQLLPIVPGWNYTVRLPAAGCNSRL